MKNHQLRRTVSALTVLALGGAGLTLVAAPAAHAATDDVVKLPISSFSSLVVDSVHERVFVSDNLQSAGSPGTVVVYDFGGRHLGSLTGATSVSSLALSEDSGTLYVGEAGRVARYDTATLAATGATTVSYGICERSAAVSGGQVWQTTSYQFNSGYCADGDHALGSLGTDGAAYTESGWRDYGVLNLEAGPGLPGRLFVGQQYSQSAGNPYVTVFDTTGPNPVRGAARRFADADGRGALDARDLAVSADGRYLAVADPWAGTRLLDTGDLSDAPVGYPPAPAGMRPGAVAYSADGRWFAQGGQGDGSVPDLEIRSADPASGQDALQFAFESTIDGYRVADRGLAWSADGSRLFTVTSQSGAGYLLHIIQPPAAQYDSRFTGALTTSPVQPVAYEPLAVRGRLELDGPAPADPAKVRAVRTDAAGTHELAGATVAADGGFTVLDEPTLVGEATYTVSYLGDLTHRPAADVSLTVQVAKAPSTLTLTAPAEATLAGGVEITGRLAAQGRALPAGVSLRVERTDRLGTGTLSSVTVAADGGFRINDLPRTRGDVTYTVTYAGDDLHAGASAVATVYVSRH